jgi:mono/diheme cytochrome c family protein
MRAVRISTFVLTAGMLFAPSVIAQAPDIALPPGDATRGKAIFESSKGNCQSCHRVNGAGSLFGPDLTAISAPRGGGGGGGRGGGGGAPPPIAVPPAAQAPAAATPRGGAAQAPAPAPATGAARGAIPAFGGDEAANAAIGGRGAGGGAAGARGGAGGQGGQGGVPTAQQLAQSILDPNAVVAPVNRYVQLKMKDGKTISGKLLSVDTFAYQIFDSNEKLANISKENVRESTMASPMPSYRDKLSTQELSDVVSYLMSLKGQ